MVLTEKFEFKVYANQKKTFVVNYSFLLNFLSALLMNLSVFDELNLSMNESGEIQSFSKVVGTPAVLNHNSIYTAFFTQYASPPPPPYQC